MPAMSSRTLSIFGVLALPALLLGAASARAGRGGWQQPLPPLSASETAFFETKIRPLLTEKCLSCHSSKLKTALGGLALDSKAGWKRGGGRGEAIIPGKPQESVLIRAISFKNEIPAMPPSGKLSQSEIELLTEWVRMGAPDPRENGVTLPPKRVIDLIKEGKRWTFQPLRIVDPSTPLASALSKRRSKVASIFSCSWAQTPIDKFIAAKLVEKKLTPNTKADRRTLIRRAYFDLIGLPPAPEATDAFLNDKSPKAWEKVVDALLASPQYGERWGRHWLDLARFAESHGYEQDYDRPNAYHYRDFVVKALNQDMPYNTFVRWQLAGDEIAPNNPMALMATGFLAAGTHATQITKSQVEKERYDELDDMLSVTGGSMLGLTFGCARCHDHKYDPIPTKEYYRMLSTFTTTVRSDYPVDFDVEGYNAAKLKFDAELKPFSSALDNYEKNGLDRSFNDWLKKTDARDSSLRALEGTGTPWRILEVQSATSTGGATLTEMPDGSFLASGKLPDKDAYVLACLMEGAPVSAFRLEAMTDAALPVGGPGRATNGNFALSDFKATFKPLTVVNPDSASSNPQISNIPFSSARADFEQAGLPVSATLDDNPTSAWAVDPQFGKTHAAIFKLKTPLDVSMRGLVLFTLKFENNAGHSIGRFRLSATSDLKPETVAFDAPAAPGKLARLLAGVRAGGETSEADRSFLLNWFRSIDPEWRRLKQRLDVKLATAPKPDIRPVLISSEGVTAVRTHTQGGDFLDHTYILKRGDPNNKGEIASQGFLTVLAHTSEGEKRWQEAPPKGARTGFQRRSLANWITDADQGAGQLLARVIVNRLWQHHFGQGIVRTPSDFGSQGELPTHPELLDWLAGELMRNDWRLKPIHRLMMLSAVYQESATLSPNQAKIDPENRLFSRRNRIRLEAEAVRDSLLSVSGQLDPTMFGPGTLDESMKRRSLYFFVKRSRLIPSLALFDAPNALQSIATRSTTTIAPQALMLMNSPFVKDCARSFAKRITVSNGNAPEFSVRVAYRLALSRVPDSEELREGVAFLAEQQSAYTLGNLPDAKQAALADFCQTLFALNEFVYID